VDNPYRLSVDHNVLQGGMMYIDATQIDINLTTQRMSDIEQKTTDHIREHFDVNFSFDYENTYGYFFIIGTMPVDTNFEFYLMNGYTYN
jgi:hypothetical protein